MRQKTKADDYYAEGDSIVKQVKANATQGLSTTEAADAINDAVAGLKQLAKRFRDGGSDTIKPQDIPKNLSYMAKMIDEVTRLVSFVQGGPDSRIEAQVEASQDAALDSIFQRLTNEQFQTFRQWMKEAEERGASASAKVIPSNGASLD